MNLARSTSLHSSNRLRVFLNLLTNMYYDYIGLRFHHKYINICTSKGIHNVNKFKEKIFYFKKLVFIYTVIKNQEYFVSYKELTKVFRIYEFIFLKL